MDTITSKDWRGIEVTLVYEDSGEPAQRGTRIKDFRGDEHTILSGTAPHKPSSTGRVYNGFQEFFPGVFGMKWVRK